MGAPPPAGPPGLDPQQLALQIEELRTTAADIGAKVLPAVQMPPGLPGPANTYNAALPPSGAVGHGITGSMSGLDGWTTSVAKSVNLVMGILTGAAERFPEIDRAGADLLAGPTAMHDVLDQIEHGVPKMTPLGAPPPGPAAA